MGFFGAPDVDKMEEKKNIKGLIKALRNERDWGVNREAAEALGKIGDPRAVMPLIAALKEKGMRRASVEALGKIGEPAVDPLISILKDENRHVREAAIDVLGKIRDPRAVEPLIAVLKDEYIHVRKAAISALGEIHDPRAVEPLIAVLTDEEKHVRKTAADALGKIRDPRAVEPLVATLLNTQDIQVCEAVAEALDKLGWQPDQGEAGAIYNAIFLVSIKEWEKAAALGGPAVKPLIAALDREIFNKSGRKVRQDIARRLVQIYHREGLDEQSKKCILALRGKLTKRHADSYKCGEGMGHEDKGIGVRFPL